MTNNIVYSIIRREIREVPTVDKIIEKMKRQPNAIRPIEAEKVLNAFILYNKYACIYMIMMDKSNCHLF